MKIQGLNKKATIFVLGSLLSKFMAGLLQIYAMYVITKMHSEEGAALVFLLSGYAIWFQLSELGLSQTLQNKFNAREICVEGITKVMVAHYILLILVGVIIVVTPYLSDILLPSSRKKIEPLAFSTGAAILILAGSNVLVQRFLLIVNKGGLGNLLTLLQSCLAIGALFLYQIFEVRNILVAVIAYFGTQILVFPSILISLFLRYRTKKSYKKNVNLIKILCGSLGFFGAGFLSTIFLGLDYFFVAYYLGDKEVIAYYYITRFFFISFVMYYAYLTYKVRHFSSCALNYNPIVIKSIVQDSIIVGIFSVVLAFLIGLTFDWYGLSKVLINQDKVDLDLFFCGFLYFAIRVLRDVVVIVIAALNNKKILYQIYFIEILTSLILMPLFVPKLGGKGVFLAMMLSCFLALVFLRIRFNLHKFIFRA